MHTLESVTNLHCMPKSLPALFLSMLLCVTALYGQENSLKIYDQNKEGQINMFADNPEYFPQTVWIKLKIKGLATKNSAPDFFVIPPNTQKMLLLELIKPEDRSWQYAYDFTYLMGDASGKHNDEHVYTLPFAIDNEYKVSQGYNGNRTHQGKNALDFTMPEGTVVMAARSGLVVRVKENSDQGCGSSRCQKMGNLVTILHNDGSFADYLHLQYQGVTVELGDVVNTGDPIALSGNTGWSTGPHLHFMVQTTLKDGYASHPTVFKLGQNRNELLAEGQFYRAIK